MASLTVKGFDLADKYRMIAMILADGTMGQMMEPVELPEVAPRDSDRQVLGCHRHENAAHPQHHQLPVLEAGASWSRRILNALRNTARSRQLRQCMNPIVWRTRRFASSAFGIAARVAKNAIAAARAQGIKVGMIRPITLWPFPKAPLCEAAEHCNAFLSVEMNMGQMLEDVQLAIGCSRPVYLCNRVGGMIPAPEQVLAKICEIAKIGGAEA